MRLIDRSPLRPSGTTQSGVEVLDTPCHACYRIPPPRSEAGSFFGLMCPASRGRHDAAEGVSGVRHHRIGWKAVPGGAGHGLVAGADSGGGRQPAWNWTGCSWSRMAAGESRPSDGVRARGSCRRFVAQTRGEKIDVFKFKKRKKYRRKTGHRQELTTGPDRRDRGVAIRRLGLHGGSHGTQEGCRKFAQRSG